MKILTFYQESKPKGYLQIAVIVAIKKRPKEQYYVLHALLSQRK